MQNFPVPNKSLSGFQNFPSPSKLRWGFPDFRSSVIQSSVIQKKEEVPWTPEEITTALWLDAADSDTLTLDASDNVSQWNDKSGNDNHATQTTSSARPSVTTTGLNTKAIVSFTGSPEFLNTPVTFPSNLAVYAVVQVGGTNAIAETRPIGYSTPGFCMYKGGSGFTLNTGGQYISTPMSDSTPALTHARGVHDGNGSVSIDGGSLVTDSPIELSSDVVVLGKDGTTTRFLTGFIAEIIFLDSIPSDDNHQKIEGYLAHKWGLEANLPSDHPYKNSLPLIE